MRPIIYHVATSIDGFIAAPLPPGLEQTPLEQPERAAVIADFLHSGPHVSEYQEHLAEYDTVLMGRGTYEFGYCCGLEPGQAPYPHMQNYVFSNSMAAPERSAENLHIIRGGTSEICERVRELQRTGKAPIYLCGGGRFARTLLNTGLVSRVRLKLNPIVLGSGVPLFDGPLQNRLRLTLLSQKAYEDGVLLLDYAVESVAST